MSTGRPKSSSRETLSEAACELFLERGYDSTTVGDIAARAGVSRSSFFNYFASKADVLWAGLDERLVVVEGALEAGTEIRAALARLAEDFTPDALALALVNSAAMGIEAELERESALRRARVAVAVARRLTVDGASVIEAQVCGAAHGGAVVAAIEEWARRGPGATSLRAVLDAALDAAGPTLPRPVRQLRVVARADHFDGAVSFYRDVLGMAEQESYQGDGGARVVILDAGRATLELSNAAQIDLIDRVETDGDAPSESIRLAIEVDDTVSVTASLLEAGALLEAAPRVTPWRSRNARVRGAAGLQLTVFQELDRPS